MNEALMQTPLEAFVREVFTKNKGILSSRVRNVLLRLIRHDPTWTVERFCFMGREVMEDTRNMGKKTLAYLEQTLEGMGLGLRHPGRPLEGKVMTNLDYVTGYVGDPEAAENLDELLDGVRILDRAMPDFEKRELTDGETVTVPASAVKAILSGWNKLVA